MKRQNQLTLLVAGVCLLLSASGCDTIQESEFVTLQVEEEFVYEINGAALDPIKLAEVHSVNLVNIGGALSGFSKDEIITADITSIEVERIQPLGHNLEAIMNDVIVYLETAGVPRIEIGRLDTIPDADLANVPFVPTGLVAPFLKAQEFRTALRFNPVDSPPDQTVRLRVTINFAVTVEGP